MFKLRRSEVPDGDDLAVLVDSMWCQIRDSPNPRRVPSEFMEVLVASKRYRLLALALTFLLARINAVAQYGGQFADASGLSLEEYASSRHTIDSLTAAVLPRVHVIDSSVPASRVSDFISVMMKTGDVTQDDCDKMELDLFPIMFLALAFGYPRDHQIWRDSEALLKDRQLRRKLKAAVQAAEIFDKS